MKVHRALRIAIGVAVFVLSFAVGLTMFAGRFIYFPTVIPGAQAETSARAAGAEPWRGPDGALAGWRWPSPDAARVLLAFHGNAGMALDRRYIVDLFSALPGGWEVVVFEYPGYGPRPGSLSEAAFFAAAEAAFDHLRASERRPIDVLGESIGSGTACHLAAERAEHVGGLVLVTPFTTLPDVAAVHFPWVPANLLLRERFDNVRALRRYRGPVAVLVAGHDEVVPKALGRRLFDGYGGPKRLFEDADAGHNDLGWSPLVPWWREIALFLVGPTGP